MSPENASQMGYLLLLVGIALSIIGYVIYINIRGEKGSHGSEEETAHDEPGESTEMSPDWVESLQGESQPPAESISGDDIIVPMPPEEQPYDLEPDAGTQSEDDMKPPTITPGKPELIPVANLFREGVTGRLVIKVGDNQYSELDTLKNSKDWSKVRSLATDLNDWIEARPFSSQTPTREGSTTASSGESPTSDSGSMIAQINDILSRKVQAMEGEDREIRLVEGLLGALEVRIGVEKFPITEVPYPDVRDLIQEAVSQWERSQ